MRPELQRLFTGLEPERDLRLLLRVFRTAHLEEHVPRETVLGKVLERPIAELRPADGNAAMEAVLRRVFGVLLGRTEDDGGMSRRTVGQDVGAIERDLGRAVLVGNDDVREAREAVTENDASRRAETRVELCSCHTRHIIPLSDQKFTVQGPWERQQALTDSTVGST